MPSPPWRRLTSRRFVRLGAAAAALVALASLSASVLLTTDDPPSSRRAASRHTLAVDEAYVADERGGQRLVVRGGTTLPDGCQLSVLLHAGEREVLRLGAAVQGGRFALDVPAQGAVVEGRYQARAVFSLEDQPPATREALRYEPRLLEARAPVRLPPEVARAADARDELRRLFDALSRAPRDPAIQDEVDRRAAELAGRLWLSEQRAALASLRLAVAVARRPAFEREEFERLLLEAHVQAGL
jgi:hypothetical protein